MNEAITKKATKNHAYNNGWLTGFHRIWYGRYPDNIVSYAGTAFEFDWDNGFWSGAKAAVVIEPGWEKAHE